MQKIIVNLVLVFSALITLNANDLKIQCKSPVQSFSNMKKIHSGDYSANVLFKDVKFTNNSIGYGAGKDKQYEISILDGKIYMARPDKGGKTIMRHIPHGDDGAMMLQVATVKKWGKYKTLDEMDDFDVVNFELDDIVDESGCNSDLALPFKIVGHASSVMLSMDTDNHRIDTIKNKDIVLEGIYSKSKKNKSKYFMVKGTNTHAHVILTREDLAGHLKNVILDKGAKLYLPIK